MERQTSLLAARGVTDQRDRLLSADDPLAELHQRCGGTLPGTLAVPELLELVQQGRRMGLRISREFSAFDGDEMVSGLVRVHPLEGEEGGGCELLIENWQSRAVPEPNSRDVAAQLDEIDRACAEVTVRLDTNQRVQLIQSAAADAAEFQEKLAEEPGSVWTDHVTLEGMDHRQPLHWRLLDGSRCHLPGSARPWCARLLPLETIQGDQRGFELLLIADYPLGLAPAAPVGEAEDPSHAQLIGGALTPVLRQPIARIIANAETIRSRLAGPLRPEYSEYAGNIAAAGQHLGGLLDDLADLEVVEAEDFKTAREPVDLADVAKRAAGILGVRASAKSIDVALPSSEGVPMASGEFRRVLQILINVIGNAIAYSPPGSAITITCDVDQGEKIVSLSVKDQGPGIDEVQAARVFDKFERLGRDNDGGSGLGLYISSRLAAAMDGDLSVANPGEGGAIFRLLLPMHLAD
ncbi:MAG: HAMP domain-containing sensor histidine kinase [Pseudomonadota bacterium]